MKEKEIFLVPYSHLDTQWRWEFPTTISRYIKTTLEESLYLFEKYPGNQFNFTGALRYEMMKDYYPEYFEKVKQYVSEGRWHPSGTCLDETDTLIPSAESMIRNILYGDRWARKHLGRSSRDYMIPDCFGFPANMPTVLAHCGISGFSTNKLTWGSAVGIPFETGVWRGPDGSEIISALNPCEYVSKVYLPVRWSPFRLKRLKNLGRKNGVWKSFQYYGVGDIGGAPTEGSVKHVLAGIRQSEKKTGELKVRQGAAGEFFKGITDDEKKRMDRYEGDFLLINHSAGSLTSAAIMKRWNRKNEQLAFAAEAAAATAMLAAGAPYPSLKIEAAWKRVIASQMHDILPGTCTPTAYEYSQNDEAAALNIWTGILQDSARALAPLIKGNGEILLFNPCAESRRDSVDAEIKPGEYPLTEFGSIKDAEGRVIPACFSKNESGTVTVTFIPELPPLSWSRFSVSGGSGQDEIQGPVSVTETEGHYLLKNSLYCIKISLRGKIESIFHSGLNRELLKKPLAYELQKERPFTFPAWNMDWRDRKKKPLARIEDGGEVSVIENSPLRCTLRIATAYKASELIKEISLSAGSEIVEFTERINWKEKGCSLKLALTADMESPEATFNWETSRIKRGVNNSRCFEMPSRLWADISGKKCGISIIEDSKYGYDRPTEDTLRMTLLFTPAIWYINGFWDQRTQDHGEHTIRYALFGHKGGPERTDTLARRFNQPVRAFRISGHGSPAGNANLQLFSISSEQAGVLAVKKAEDRNALLVRLYERHGKECRTEAVFNFPVRKVTEVNGLEEDIGDVTFEFNKFTVSLNANGIRSYIVEPDEEKPAPDIRQKTIALDYNYKMISYNKEQGTAFFPAEAVPARIASGPVTYVLSNSGELNSLQCRGQSVAIPGGYNRLSILGASAEESTALFRWLDSSGKMIEEELHTVPSMSGFIGQWDTRTWLREPKHFLKNKRDYAWINRCTGVKPGYVSRGRLEWFCTRTYRDGEVQPYHFGYLYTIELDIPAGAESLLLPDDPRVHIMAVTVSEQGIKAESAQKLKDKYDF